MKNYVQLVFTMLWDQITPTAYVWTTTMAQSQDFQAALGPPVPPQEFLVETWYVPLNKSTVTNILNLTDPIVRTIAGMVTESPTKKSIQGKVWNSKNAAFTISKTVPGKDPPIAKPTLSEGNIFDPIFAEFNVDQFLKDLITLSDRLRKAGKVRDSGIVLFARSELIAGRMSVVELLNYLVENGIIN